MRVERLLDELRQLAENGIRYADDQWEEDRWQSVLTLVCEYYGETLDLPSEEVREQFSKEVGHVTTKVGAEAVVFNNRGEVLLVLRVDDESWALPGGWVEPGESPEEAAIRETREETGLDVESIDLINIYNRRPGEYGLHGQINIVYSCRVIGGEMASSHETLDVQYWNPDAVTEWHADHHSKVSDAYSSH